MEGFFGSNIKFFRRLKGISQQKLGEQVGLKRNNIASYESGSVEPKAVNFLKIARCFDIDPLDLLTKDLSQKPLSETIIESDKEIPTVLLDDLEQFIQQTNEFQQVSDGFIELKRFQAKHNNSGMTTVIEFSNLLEIMQYLLQANWKLIHRIQEIQKEEA